MMENLGPESPLSFHPSDSNQSTDLEPFQEFEQQQQQQQQHEDQEQENEQEEDFKSLYSVPQSHSDRSQTKLETIAQMKLCFNV